MASKAYPYRPRSVGNLEPGEFWSIPLSDGRFACGIVVHVYRSGEGSRTWFVGALLEWTGDEPPTSGSIQGAPFLEVGNVHFAALSRYEAQILDTSEAKRLLSQDAREQYILDLVSMAEHRFVGDPGPTRVLPSVKRIVHPLTSQSLLPPASDDEIVLFDPRGLGEDDLVRVSDWIALHPDVTLSLATALQDPRTTQPLTDLEFLQHLPGLRRFRAVAEPTLESIDGLRFVSDCLETLHLGATRSRVDLSILRSLTSLRTLSLEGHSKGIEALSELTDLEDLTLRSITLPDLSLLTPLRNLASLDIKLGGTKDLRLLPEVGRLRYLELWMIKGLTDISPVSDLPHLKFLFLQSLRRVEALPNLGRCVSLRRVHLQTMKGIHDLRPLTSASALEQLLLLDMSQLASAAVECLVGHPTLRQCSIGLGSMKKNAEAERILGLPGVSGVFDWRAD